MPVYRLRALRCSCCRRDCLTCCRATIPPGIFHRVGFRRGGWQGQHGDVVGDNQLLAFLVPSGAVAGEEAMHVGGNLRADSGQVLVHGLCIGGGHGDRGTDAARRADRVEDVNGIVAVVAQHGSSRHKPALRLLAADARTHAVRR